MSLWRSLTDKWLNSGMIFMFPGLPRWLGSKESACHAGAAGLIPGLGRYPGEGNGNLLQYSGLRNPMDRGPWQATIYGSQKSQIWLSNWTATTIDVSQGRAWPWLVLREHCFAPSVYMRHCGLWWAFLSDGCYWTPLKENHFSLPWVAGWGVRASWSLIYLHESTATQDFSRRAFEKVFRVR